jgi:hypothetical protein
MNHNITTTTQLNEPVCGAKSIFEIGIVRLVVQRFRLLQKVGETLDNGGGALDKVVARAVIDNMTGDLCRRRSNRFDRSSQS